MTLSLAALDIQESALGTTNSHTIDELTTVALNGTGAFDVLMRTVKLHLKDEYDKNRITGKDYSQVYLGAMTAVLQQSVAYILQQAQLEKTQAEIGLIRQQTVSSLAQTTDYIPAGLGFNVDTAVSGVAHELQQAQITKLGKDSLKVDSDILLTNAGITKMEKDALKTQSDIDVNSESILRTQAEVGLLEQKTVTELAQTAEHIPTGMGFNITTLVDGTVARQKNLFTAQTDGYKRDAEQKAAKILADAWSIQRSTDDLAPVPPALDNTSIGQVIAKLKLGIGV